MNSTTDLDDKIRCMLAELDRATPRPPTFDELHRGGRTESSRLAPLVGAAAIVVLGVGGIMAVGARDAGPTTTPAALPAASQSTTGFHLEIPTVRMDAASIEVFAADRTWVPTADLVVEGDPGMPNEFTTLELTWSDDGIEQRVHLYFASDGIDWWVNEIRTYDGRIPGDWITPFAEGEYFRSPLGTAFVGDLDLPNLRIHDMTLEAFLRPNVCDNPTTPTALLADYPTVTTALLGGFGASFQVIDTATCTPLAVAPYQFEFTADDPAIVRIEPPETIDGYPEIKTRIGLTFLAPGTTTVRATARNNLGEIVGTATMQVEVRPAGDDTLDMIAPDTAPPTVADSAQGTSRAESSADIANRVGYVTEPLAMLGYTVTATERPTDALTTIITAVSDTDDQVVVVTMSPGTMLQPENHNRVPITIVEQTDLQIRGRVDSNSGWKFEITASRSPDDGPLPSTTQLQEVLYTLDP